MRCALLAALIARHAWGTPIDEDHLLSIAAFEPERYPRARQLFEDLRGESYVRNRGKRGIQLDSGAFGDLADVLFDECDWEPYEIRSRLKHYEGWDDHDWA